MTVLWITLGALLIIAGIIGCVLPVIPGPALAYCGLLPLIPLDKTPSAAVWALTAALLVSAFIFDAIIPAAGAKKFKCTKYGIAGCIIGTGIGTFFLPLGLLLGPFLGAFIGEIISGRRLSEAAAGGTGAFLGFLAGTAYKLLACSIFAFCFVNALLK